MTAAGSRRRADDPASPKAAPAAVRAAVAAMPMRKKYCTAPVSYTHLDVYKRQVLLAICTFSLSLLGTFLVRSGVLTSVHAFAVDPGRGLYILGFMTLVVGGSLTLYALSLIHI